MLTHLVKLDAALDDGVSNGAGISEGGDVLADLVEAEGQVLAERTAKLSLALLAQNNKLGALGAVGSASGRAKLQELSLGTLGDRRVDTTAKTLVRGDNDEELAPALRGNGLGVLEDLCTLTRALSAPADQMEERNGRVEKRPLWRPVISPRTL